LEYYFLILDGKEIKTIKLFATKKPINQYFTNTSICSNCSKRSWWLGNTWCKHQVHYLVKSMF